MEPLLQGGMAGRNGKLIRYERRSPEVCGPSYRFPRRREQAPDAWARETRPAFQGKCRGCPLEARSRLRQSARPRRSSMALEFVSVTRRFGSQLALEGLSIRVRDGDCYGFIGHNGAGKTTAMRIALGLQACDAGHVLVDGFDVRA